ncbi:MAG: alpha/beta fold hydrolase [bacterium]|nr:alpha/beta fold hydrolase [bacterium]
MSRIQNVLVALAAVATPVLTVAIVLLNREPLHASDCNANGLEDFTETTRDCNGNGIPDECLDLDKRLRFGTPTTYPVASPIYTVAADFDRDGDPDLATVQLGTDSIAVRYNDGRGNFNISATYTVKSSDTFHQPSDVVAEDLDMDGTIDLTTCNFTAGGISILLNRGDGTFAEPRTLPELSPQNEWLAIVSDDLDGDGDNDIALTGRVSHSRVSVLKNSGDGTLGEQQSYIADPLGFAFGYKIRTADLDLDGDVDLVASIRAGRLSLLRNSGVGTFVAPEILPVFGEPQGAPEHELVDFDRDGDIDIVATTLGAGVIVLYQDDSGSFGNQRVVGGYPGTYSLSVGDFDGDGALEFGKAATEENRLAFFIPSTPVASEFIFLAKMNHPPRRLISGDWDQDGDLDIVTTNQDGSISVLLNNNIGFAADCTRHQLHLFRGNQWVPLTDEARVDFNPALPAIVIVHGWNSELADQLPAWTLQTALAFAARTATPYVNLLAWDWMLEAKGNATTTFNPFGLEKAAAEVYDQSAKLASALRQTFAARGFTRPVHLMGHSLGSFVVTFTGLQLQDLALGTIYDVANVTLWDPPDAVPNSLADNVPLLRSLGTYVDNFRGAFNRKTYFANAWVAAPSASDDGTTSHDTYRWYRERVQPADEPILHTTLTCTDDRYNGTVGFGASVTHAPPTRQLRFPCDAGDLGVSLVADSADTRCADARDLTIYGQYCVADARTTPVLTLKLDTGIGNNLCDCLLPTDLDLRMRIKSRQALQGGGAGLDDLTATYTLPVTMAEPWDFLQFGYQFVAAPTPAALTVSIIDGVDETPLLSLTSESNPIGVERLSPLLDISSFRGKTVDLVFSLTSSQEGASVEISNLTALHSAFHANVPPNVSAGADQAIAVTDPISTAVTLNGSATSDTNGDPLVYAWTLPSGIAAVGVQPTLALPLGGYPFTLHARDPFDGFGFDETVVEVEYPFVRGDANADGEVDITDPIVTLEALFLDTGVTLCNDAADTNDNSAVDISDPIATLGFLFLGTADPKSPYPAPGLDPTPDLLGCTLSRP